MKKHDFLVHHMLKILFLRILPVLLVLICLFVGLHWQLAHWRHLWWHCKTRNLIGRQHAGSFYQLTYCFYPDRIFSVDLNLKKWTPFKNYHINIKSENKIKFLKKNLFLVENGYFDWNIHFRPKTPFRRFWSWLVLSVIFVKIVIFGRFSLFWSILLSVELWGQNDVIKMTSSEWRHRINDQVNDG